MLAWPATFFPVTAFPGVLPWAVKATPLYRGVTLTRELTTGALSADSLVSVLYLGAMGVLGLAVVSRRSDELLLT